MGTKQLLKTKKKIVNKDLIKLRIDRKIQEFNDIQENIKVLDEKSKKILDEIIILNKQINKQYTFRDLLNEEKLLNYYDKVESFVKFKEFNDRTVQFQREGKLSNKKAMLLSFLPNKILKDNIIQDKIVDAIIENKITREDLIKTQTNEIYKKIGYEKDSMEEETRIFLRLCYSMNEISQTIKDNSKVITENSKNLELFKKNFDNFIDTVNKFIFFNQNKN